STPIIQRQALQWLQKLCLLHISIPLNILFEMFNLGVDTMSRDEEGCPPDQSEKDSNKEPLKINFEWEVEDVGFQGYSKYDSGDHLKEEEEEPNATILSGENKLSCYNLMVDVLNSQLELQDVEKYVGLLGAQASEVLG
ncbi:Uncharacterized protein FKW44_011734, partial [Caligus rogercresseyi]